MPTPTLNSPPTQGKAQLQALWGPSLYHIDDLPFAQGLGDMPTVFTPFRDKVEKKCQVRRLKGGQLGCCACAATSHHLSSSEVRLALQRLSLVLHCTCVLTVTV